MHPLSPTHPSDWERRRVEAQEAYANAYRQLFPGIDVPVVVGTTCCAQFAASRTAIRRRPRSDYVHFRKWLLGTKLKDEISGRVFEYVWHIIFGDLNGVGVLWVPSHPHFFFPGNTRLMW